MWNLVSMQPPSLGHGTFDLFLISRRHRLYLQHRWQHGRELRHGERLRGLWEQRHGQLCGPVCCPLHRQGVHGERSHPGAHQEPAQHDPRCSIHTQVTTQIPCALCSVPLACMYSELMPTPTEMNKLNNSWYVRRSQKVDTYGHVHLLCVYSVTDPCVWPTGIVAMQMEALEAVHRESRRLPPIQKVSLFL